MTGTSAPNSAAMTAAHSASQNPRRRSGAAKRPIAPAPSVAAAGELATMSHRAKRIIPSSLVGQPPASAAVWRLPARRF